MPIFVLILVNYTVFDLILSIIHLLSWLSALFTLALWATILLGLGPGHCIAFYVFLVTVLEEQFGWS